MKIYYSEFLNEDIKTAIKEINCFTYCIKHSNNQLFQKEYAKAAAYLENAQRSLLAIEQLKQNKIQQDALIRQLERRMNR